MRKILLFVAVILLSQSSFGQRGYAFRVQFCDKVGGLTLADSAQFLSQKSLDRRAAQGIAVDNTDIPVVQAYVDSVMSISDALTLHNRSKWFNQIVIITYDSLKINDVLSLPYVCSAKMVAQYPNYTPKTDGPTGISAGKFPRVEPISNKTTGDPAYYGLTFQQVNMLKVDCLHDLGFKGQGMTVAVLDAGFKHHDTHTQFDSLRNENRLLHTYSFVYDSTDIMIGSNDHGTNVTGLIIGEDPGSYIGIAPKTNIYMLQTEDVRTEQPIEEDNWLSAAEWADSAGTDIINGSLGYNKFNTLHPDYVYSVDFDGNTTLIAQAANMAVSKGIFTCVAIGNEGSLAWHYMLTPGDADSAFSVGSVDGSGAWGQSSYGPNADGQTKPNGMALGRSTVLIGANGQPGVSNGSSFASPLMAGAVACLWQAAPTKTESEIRHLVMQVSDRFTAPNNTHGFGIPDFCLAHNVATGVDDFENQIEINFDVYPNPTTGAFSIRVKEAALPYDFDLYDVTGKKISSLKNINNFIYTNNFMEKLPAGTYFVKINSKLGAEEATLIKK